MATPPDSRPDITAQRCLVCLAEDIRPYGSDRARSYVHCPTCALVFVPPAEYLSPRQEKAQYDMHENNPDDPGYRRFLGRLFTPLCERLQPGARGLDFGSGPGPTLSVMLEERGHPMALYDHFYCPDQTVFDHQYQFITATEVVEHLHHPLRELQRLWSCLQPGGVLGIMTKMVESRDAFFRWHYKNDPTHVCFFSRHTFEHLSRQWRARLDFVANDALILAKPDI